MFPFDRMTAADPEPVAPPAWRRWALRFAVAVVVSGAIVGALLTQVDLDRVFAVLAGTAPLLLLAGLGVYVLLGIVRAWRVRLLLPNVSFASLYAIINVHQLLLRVMPMRTGELAFAWLMRRSGGAGFTRSLVGLFLLRILDLTTVLVIYAIGLAFVRSADHSSGGRTVAIVVALAVVMTLVALSMRALLRIGQSVLEGLIRALRLDRFAIVERGRAALAEAVRWSSELPARALWQATGLTALQSALSFALMYVVAQAVGLEISPAQAILGGMGAVVGGLLPIPGVGSFGGLEAGWAAGFALVGVETETAIATAFAFSVITFGYAILTALAGLPWLRRTAAAAP